MKYAALVIRDHDGNIVDVTLSSEKSRNKSVEQGELWIVDIDTRRVLPYRGGGVPLVGGFADGGFRENVRWFEVLVDDTAFPPREETGSIAVAERSGETAPHRQEDATSLDASVGPLLADLTATIADRRRTLPEGSYTTHLFTKGSAKIRKKTGEEAVELILAHDRDELVSEAADLIYHLMVLLETEELTIADVINRLAERHQRG